MEEEASIIMLEAAVTLAVGFCLVSLTLGHLLLHCNVDGVWCGCRIYGPCHYCFGFYRLQAFFIYMYKWKEEVSFFFLGSSLFMVCILYFFHCR